jgi:hypothetical protein
MSWTHLSDTTPKARKQYRCDICNEIIEVGEDHVARRGAGEGRIVTMRMHLDCEEFSKAWDQMDWECHCPGDCTRQEVRDSLARKLNASANRHSEKRAESDSASGRTKSPSVCQIV